MSGHSKWANIKHRKAAADAKKGKAFTRLIKEITVAARLGGGDPNTNPRLRLAMDKAREANMTKDSVQNAIKRGSGQLDGVSYEEARYEGYGVGGAAIIVECLTDSQLSANNFGPLKSRARVRTSISSHSRPGHSSAQSSDSCSNANSCSSGNRS